jgi:hypothetical protein
VALAVAYVGLLHHLPTLTGVGVLDGCIGVMLGLFICAQPAANAVNVWFYERDSLRHISSELSGILWLTLNVLALALGWLAATVGVARLVNSASGRG